jgi:uncharacterized coiled-coil protein SlyX
MSESVQARLDRLESLYSEQDHTMQMLNDMVAQQSQEISRLQAQLEQMKIQLQSLKTESASEVDSPSHGEFEIPPHY